MQFWSKILYYLAITTFLISLALPCIIYTPNINVSPKAYECNDALTHPDWVCYQFSFGNGGRIGDSKCQAPNPRITTPIIDKNQIMQYCAGWDKIETFDLGYVLLLWGWFAGGCIAWYANPLFLWAIIIMKSGKYKIGMSISLIAFVLGFFSFGCPGKLLDEGGHRLGIDHLGIGYYIWELSFLLLAASCAINLVQNFEVPSKEKF